MRRSGQNILAKAFEEMKESKKKKNLIGIRLKMNIAEKELNLRDSELAENADSIIGFLKTI